MPSSPPVNDVRTNRYAIPLFFALIAAGLAGNYFKFHILNLDFIFGSIFAMLVLQFFGLGRGILAAAIISSYTYLTWNHPYAIITMTAEVAVVGWLSRHRKINLLVADTLYWIIIGIPVGYFCFHFIAHLPVSNAMFLMTKQSVNGITNALIARLIFTGYALRSKSSAISFREIMLNLLAFFVLCSALIMLIVGSRTDFDETDRSIRTLLTHDSLRVTDRLQDWLEDRKRVVVNLAGMAETLSPEQVQTRLEQVRTSGINFLRTVLIDKEGISVAYSPLVDELGRNNIGKNFADRSYIPALKQTLKPMLSEVMVSRFGNPNPVVIMLAPVLSHGVYSGAVGGILSINRIKSTLETSFTGQNMLYALLDKNGNVIVTNHNNQKVMTPFSRDKGTLSHHQEGISQWIPTLPPNISTIELWGRSHYVAESTIGRLAEWRLILEQPVAPFQKMLYDRYTGKITLLFLILIALLTIAELISRGITRTNERLCDLTRDLPGKLEAGITIEWPESGIQDSKNLIANFRKMANSLATRFSEIRLINELLEKRIEERTYELKVNEEHLSNAMEMAHLGHWEYDVATDLFTFNDHFYKIFRTTAKQVGGYTMSSAEYARRFVHPDDAPTVGEETRKAIETTDPHFSRQLEHRIICADGTVGHITVRFFIVKDAHGRTVKTYGVNQDITERKQAEEERLRLENDLRQAQRLESIGNLAGGIAHDFNNILSSVIGFTELSLDEVEKGTHIEDNLQEVYTAGKRAKDLVRQILAFARQSEEELKPIQVDMIATEVLKFIRASIPTTIEIRQNIESNSLIMGNATQVHQVLMNLFTNAAHAMEDKGGVLEFSLKDVVIDRDVKWEKLDLEPGNYIEIKVSDTGAGIAFEIIGSIFEPYFTTKSPGEGTGMGLATVHGIIESYGGKISVDSKPGQGTLFTIYLPVTRKRQEHHLYQSEKLPTGTERILFVDDEASITRMGSQVLEHLGYFVTNRTSSVEALALFRSKPNDFDLVITDMTMPNMNGDKLAAEMMAIRRDIPVILCTGYSKKISDDSATAIGIKAFAYKPIVKADLAKTVRKVLDEAKG